MAIILALMAFFSWGISDIFGGLVSRKFGGYSSAFWSEVICILIASLYIPFTYQQLSKITLESVIWLLILIPVGLLPFITFYEGLRVGNASLVGTIAGSFGSLVVILSVIFLGERINTAQVISMVIIFTGVILSSLNFNNLKAKQILTDKGIPYALISFFLWGIYFTFIKIPVRNFGWFWPSYFSWCGFPLILLFMKVKSVKLQFIKGNKYLIFVTINALLQILGLFSYNLASTKGQTAIVAPIASSYPVLFAVLAYFVFKDRLSKQQVMGVIITLTGIIFLSILT
jgi:uncharacterized membrane protein